MTRLLTSLLLLAAINVASATITPIQYAKATMSGGGTALNFTMPSAVTTGNYIIATITQTQGTFTKCVPNGIDKDWVGGPVAWGANAGANVFTYVYFFKVITGGQTAVAFSIPSGNITGCGIVREYSGKNITPDVWRTGNNATSTTLTTNVTDTTNTANELIVASMCIRGQFSVEQTGASAWASSPTNSFSIIEQTSTTLNTTNGDRAIAFLERFVTSTGTFSTGVTSNVSQAWATPIATFRELPQVSSTMSAD